MYRFGMLVIACVLVTACQKHDDVKHDDVECAQSPGRLDASYYTLPEVHPDMRHGIDNGTVPALVEADLGPHGWPVVTAAGRNGPQSSGRITDINADGELLWWSETSPHGVQLEKNVVECIPINHPAMFADGYSDDQKYFLTGHLHGYFNTHKDGEQASLSEGSDDDSWVFIDGKLALDNGGVKPQSTQLFRSRPLAPGRHALDLFYADRHAVQAQLRFEPYFAIDTDAR